MPFLKARIYSELFELNNMGQCDAHEERILKIAGDTGDVMTVVGCISIRKKRAASHQGQRPES